MAAMILNDVRVEDTVSDEDLQRFLQQHYDHSKGTPATCLCNATNPRMYIAHVGDRYILKRWPGSGSEHSAGCDRYEPPLEASGIGKLLGGAIDEDPNTGEVSLALGFSLKRSPRLMEQAKKIIEKKNAAEIHEPPAIQTNSKLSLRATLHYIWEGAKLNQWRPAMVHGRSWRDVHRVLKDTTRHLSSKGHVLANRMYIPEPFVADDKEAIRMRRRAFFQTVASNKPARELLMFLFEVKSIEVVDGGYAVTAKHVPDDQFFMSEDTYKVLRIRYENEFSMLSRESLRKATPDDPPNHLMAFGIFSVMESGIATIEDAVLMMVTSYWIPISDATEELCVKYAQAKKRFFSKPLSYNGGPGTAVASLILLDTPERATSLWVIRSSDSSALHARRADAIEKAKTNCVFIDFNTGDSIAEVMDRIPKLTAQVHAPA